MNAFEDWLIASKTSGFIKLPPRFVNQLLPLITVFIFSLLAFPKLQSYKSIDVFRNPSVSVPEESMRQLFDRLAPASGDQCWINIDCSANLENFKIDTSGYFKVATLNN